MLVSVYVLGQQVANEGNYACAIVEDGLILFLQINFVVFDCGMRLSM
jgi:hypothetical protein